MALAVMATFAQTTFAKTHMAVVVASVARLHVAPDLKSKVLRVLPIATEVRVLGRSGTFSRVQTLRHKGYIATKLLGRHRPNAQKLLERAKHAKGARQRRLLERATAAAPSDLRVIEAFIAGLEKRHDENALYYARKGWVAAKRRTLMWDGPLYPITEQKALLPLPCGDAATANGNRTEIPNDELRARAFPLVSSGKVVSLTEQGGVTQRLSHPGCQAEQLVYELPKLAKEGALVPSWLVAGHQIVPFVAAQTPVSSRKSRHHKSTTTPSSQTLFTSPEFAISVKSGTWRLIQHRLRGDRKSPDFQVPDEAKGASLRPIVWFADTPDQVRILWRSEKARDCAPGDFSVFLSRVQLSSQSYKKKAEQPAPMTVENGRLWSSALVPQCAQTRFSPLPGEPRDISHENLLGPNWKR